jgi:hypothetical protein
MAGVVKLIPVPSELPPLEAAYQFNIPPGHPEAFNCTVPVPQRALPVTVGAAGIELTVATTSVLGPSQPAALVHDTQKDVVELTEGVVKEVPVPMDDPPEATLYHVSVPVQPEAVSVTVPGPHLAKPLPAGAAGIGLTVAVTAVLALSQPWLFVHDT